MITLFLTAEGIISLYTISSLSQTIERVEATLQIKLQHKSITLQQRERQPCGHEQEAPTVVSFGASLGSGLLHVLLYTSRAQDRHPPSSLVPSVTEQAKQVRIPSIGKDS